METKEKFRKTYKKPQVNEVKLEIKEAVLAACKAFLTDGNGKNTSGCDIPKCRRQPYGS